LYATHLLLGRLCQFDRKTKHGGFKNKHTLEKYGKTYTLTSLSFKQVYIDQLNLKKAKKKTEQTSLQNNGEDMRLSKNKVSHECETPKDKVLAIKDKFEVFSQKQNRKVECGEKKERVRKEKCVEKIKETP